MANESLADSRLVSALRHLLADGADLARKELRLARAEIAAAVGEKLSAGVWMAVAAFLLIVASLLLVQALVFAIASFGIALHWSCLIAAAILVAIAGGCFLYAKTRLRGPIIPERTVARIEKDIQALRSN